MMKKYLVLNISSDEEIDVSTEDTREEPNKNVKKNNNKEKIQNLTQLTKLQEKHKEELLEIQREHQKELQNIRILQEKQIELQTKNNELCLQHCKDSSEDSSNDKIAVLEQKNKDNLEQLQKNMKRNRKFKRRTTK